MWDFAKFLIGYAGGLATPFALRWLTRYFLGPRLVVEFNSDEVPAGAGKFSTPQYFCRIKVRNDKPLAAHACRGYLTKIELVGSTGPFRTLLEETFQLIWSYDDKRDSFDLPRGPAPTIDVAVYHLGDTMFYPCMRGGGLPTKFDGSFTAAGTYRFTVLVAGHDVEPVMRVIEVTYDGQNWPPTGKAV